MFDSLSFSAGEMNMLIKTFRYLQMSSLKPGLYKLAFLFDVIFLMYVQKKAN